MHTSTLPLRILLLVLSGLALPARPASAAPELVRGTVRHQGLLREYYVLLPAGHDRSKAVPLVIGLHGGGGTARSFDKGAGGQFARESEARGWVVVYPQGIRKGWNDGRIIRTRREADRSKVDDVDFIRTLIDRLHATYGIDRERVYATGISNGGFMSYRLGIELSDRIAAIAPVTANLSTVMSGKTPGLPIPVMVLNGTKDPLVPYDGGQVRVLGQDRGSILSTDATIAWWRKHNGCTASATNVVLPDRSPRDGTRVHVDKYTNCPGGAPVILVRIEGGGHTWPGGWQYLPRLVIGRVSRDIDGGSLIFDFFARHKRPQAGPATAPVAPSPQHPQPGARDKQPGAVDKDG
jgi:polyhydroxybutyrate depolymerase